ncbi:MAG: response regulator [Lewinellaceae bacterium]|nr:response regulator [Lewinellaceae bacterium]
MEHITIADGLSQGMIFDILQTQDGFIWVATKDGLNRYDGYNFKVFLNDPFDPFSIAENAVTSLFEDSKGRLWVGLQNKGVDVYDPGTGRFYHLALDFMGQATQLGNPVEDISETPDGAVWALLINNGLARFHLPAGWKSDGQTKPDLSEACHPAKIEMPAPSAAVQPEKPELFKSLAVRPNGQLLVFSEKAVYVVETNKQSVRALEGFYSDKPILRAARTESRGEEVIWLARFNDKAELAGADVLRWRNGQSDIFPLPERKRNLWKRLLPGKANHVWMVLGREIWDLAPDVAPDFNRPDFVFDAVPTCWTYDRNGNAWIGTNGYGLRKLNHLQGVFHAGAANWTIDGLWANNGRYFCKWVKDIRVYDPQTGLLTDRPAFSDAPFLQISMAFEPSGAVWLLAASEEKVPKQMLLKYAPASQGPAERRYEFNAGIGLRTPLLRTRDGRLWIAAQGGQIVRFDPIAERFDYFDVAHLFGDEAKVVQPVALAEDDAGVIWLGTILGLVKCTPTTKGIDFQLIHADPNNPDGLNNNSIACIFPGPDGLLWLGTKGGGINIMDTRTGHCQHITTGNGLLNNVVYGILPGNTPDGKDRPDELWCSTNRGLAKINVIKKDPFDFKVTTYTAELGLQDNEFNTQAYFKTGNGELLFGGINGLNRFFPEQLPLDTLPPAVYVIGVEINHQKASADRPGSLPELLTSLKLRHDQNNLSFEFAALDFTAPSKNRYRYRLVGLDDNWVETGNRRFAHFSHLPPGRYEFRVQGSNGESDWASAPHPVTVVVLPPWWRSNLAYLCYFLLLGWVSWLAYRFQIQRVKEREQLAFEQRETERVKALEEMKTNFFNSITHEFRTPLTLIIEPLRQLVNNPGDPDYSEKIRLAEKNSRRLLSLINQLLDLAKIESGNMSLDLRQGNFEQTVRDVFETFLALAEKKKIGMTLAIPHGIPEFGFDAGKVELVLNNLISNALKFTPEGGRVTLSVGMRDEERGMIQYSPSSLIPPPFSLCLTVTDTGIGIPAGALNKIFDRFYQVDGPHTRHGEGTGIGLALSRELAGLMGGGIEVESQVGQGSSFTFWLPLPAGTTRSAPEGQAGAGPEISGRPMPAPRPDAGTDRPVVLVVEDNDELRAFIRQSINGAWEVAEASNGEEGFQTAVELLPDLVISDVMMPAKNGYELCDELKTNELTAHVPIILLTAKSAIESKLQGLRTGADDYLTKPFNTEELLTRMDNLVKLRHKLREHYSGQPVKAALVEADNLNAPDREFLRKFTSLLEEHLSDETLGVEGFSKKMFLSRSQLHRKLKAIAGRSATDFIRDYRLEQAYALLQEGVGSVGEVALRVGFGNEKYFSTMFREKYGVPPSQLRQR